MSFLYRIEPRLNFVAVAYKEFNFFVKRFNPRIFLNCFCATAIKFNQDSINCEYWHSLLVFIRAASHVYLSVGITISKLQFKCFSWFSQEVQVLAVWAGFVWGIRWPANWERFSWTLVGQDLNTQHTHVRWLLLLIALEGSAIPPTVHLHTRKYLCRCLLVFVWCFYTNTHTHTVGCSRYGSSMCLTISHVGLPVMKLDVTLLSFGSHHWHG